MEKIENITTEKLYDNLLETDNRYKILEIKQELIKRGHLDF